MKNLIFLLLLIFSFYSCGKRDKIVELPVEKVYIVEYTFSLSEVDEDNKIGFNVKGFSELDKNYNLKFAFRSSYDSYYTSVIEVTDSLKRKIADVIKRYPSDTLFSYKGEGKCDGNNYSFIIQKNDGVKTQIFFSPEYLPDDLMFLYNLLYEDIKKNKLENKYDDLFKEFEDIIMSGPWVVPPPPLLKSTVQFKPPVVVK